MRITRQYYEINASMTSPGGQLFSNETTPGELAIMLDPDLIDYFISLKTHTISLRSGIIHLFLYPPGINYANKILCLSQDTFLSNNSGFIIDNNVILENGATFNVSVLSVAATISVILDEFIITKFRDMMAYIASRDNYSIRVDYNAFKAIVKMDPRVLEWIGSHRVSVGPRSVSVIAGSSPEIKQNKIVFTPGVYEFEFNNVNSDVKIPEVVGLLRSIVKQYKNKNGKLNTEYL